MEIVVKDQTFILLPEKAVYWKNHQTLLIADLHLGKARHFRNSGIPIPLQSEVNNLRLLEKVIIKSKCDHILFLGDLFHSVHNSTCDKFLQWRNNFSSIGMSLVEGNHDILHLDYYALANLKVMDKASMGPFVFTHKPFAKNKLKKEEGYNIAGHIHPGVKLRGKARQSISLSCFYFGKNNGLLHDFVTFTGNCIIVPEKEDDIYVIANNLIQKI